jgi:serine/threonine protein kinase
VAATQAKSISHGDIKPANIFCRDTSIYLGDFGGAIDHTDSAHIQEQSTAMYRLVGDEEIAKAALNRGDLATFQEIEMKCDVLASSASFIVMATNDLPYDEDLFLDKHKVQLKTDVIEKLIAKGFSQQFVDMLVLGLNEDYQKRPTSLELFKAASQELQRVDSQKWEELQKISSQALITA